MLRLVVLNKQTMVLKRADTQFWLKLDNPVTFTI